MEEQDDITLAMARDKLHKGMREQEEEERSTRKGGRAKGRPDKKPRQGLCKECGKMVLKKGMKAIKMPSGQKVFVCPNCLPTSSIVTNKKTGKISKVKFSEPVKIVQGPLDDGHYKECLSCCGVNFHVLGNATVKCSQCGSTFRFAKGI